MVIAKTVFVLTIMVLLSSSYIYYYYSAHNFKDSENLLTYILGDVVTSYLINTWVICSYTCIYLLLRRYYRRLLIKFANLLSTVEKTKMAGDVKTLAIFFLTICLVFLSRIAHQVQIDIDPDRDLNTNDLLV